MANAPTIHDLRSAREEILALATRHHAFDVRVFGSVARGDAGPESDVDFLVSFAGGASLLDQVALRDGLAELLRARVDVVSSKGLSRYIGATILDEAVPL